MKNTFHEDFQYMKKRIFEDKKPTAFARYNEGEYKLINDLWFVWAWRKRRSYPEYNKLKKILLRIIQEKHDDNYFIGIASKKHPEANQRYKTIVKSNITFAVLRMNDNRKYFKPVLENITEDVVLVANKIAQQKIKSFPFTVKDYESVPLDCVKMFDFYHKQYEKSFYNLAYKHNNTLFFIAAWPMSGRVVDYMWNINKTNRYIDIGSCLDEYIMGKKTRNYFRPKRSQYSQVDVL